jgi:ribosomal protein S18 acetylase RimI-like enzyme
MTGPRKVEIPVNLDAGEEADFSQPADADEDRPARDRMPVRSMAAGDLDAIARIDRHITGRDRTDYLRHKLDEALLDSAVRVSLVAEHDGAPVGFVMARVDFGDYGRTEPVADLDTIGVHPDFAHHGVGRALLSQLLLNLAALHVERLETQVRNDDLELLRFFQAAGGKASQRLVFEKRVG